MGSITTEHCTCTDRVHTLHVHYLYARHSIYAPYTHKVQYTCTVRTQYMHCTYYALYVYCVL